MVAGNLKRVVVLRNISSNVIEEAILILKNEPGSDDEKQPKAGVKKRKQDDIYLLKEAEMIINNYVRENRIQITQNKRDRNRGGYFGKRPFLNIFINVLMLACIAFLLYIVLRLI